MISEFKEYGIGNNSAKFHALFTFCTILIKSGAKLPDYDENIPSKYCVQLVITNRSHITLLSMGVAIFEDWDPIKVAI